MGRIGSSPTYATADDPGHKAPVWSVAVGRCNGRHIIVSGSDDCTVRSGCGDLAARADSAS